MTEKRAKKLITMAEKHGPDPMGTYYTTLSCAYSLLAILDELKSINNKEKN